MCCLNLLHLYGKPEGLVSFIAKIVPAWFNHWHQLPIGWPKLGKIPTSKSQPLHAKLNLRVDPTLRVRRENPVAKFDNLTKAQSIYSFEYFFPSNCPRQKENPATNAMSSQGEDNMVLSSLPETVDPMIVRPTSLQFAKFLGQRLIVYSEQRAHILSLCSAVTFHSPTPSIPVRVGYLTDHSSGEHLRSKTAATRLETMPWLV